MRPGEAGLLPTGIESKSVVQQIAIRRSGLLEVEIRERERFSVGNAIDGYP